MNIEWKFHKIHMLQYNFKSWTGIYCHFFARIKCKLQLKYLSEALKGMEHELDDFTIINAQTWEIMIEYISNLFFKL